MLLRWRRKKHIHVQSDFQIVVMHFIFPNNFSIHCKHTETETDHQKFPSNPIKSEAPKILELLLLIHSIHMIHSYCQHMYKGKLECKQLDLVSIRIRCYKAGWHICIYHISFRETIAGNQQQQKSNNPILPVYCACQFIYDLCYSWNKFNDITWCEWISFTWLNNFSTNLHLFNNWTLFLLFEFHEWKNKNSMKFDMNRFLKSKNYDRINLYSSIEYFWMKYKCKRKTNNCNCGVSSFLFSKIF